MVVNIYIRTHTETDTHVYVHDLAFQLWLLEGTGSDDTSVAQSQRPLTPGMDRESTGCLDRGCARM